MSPVPTNNATAITVKVIVASPTGAPTGTVVFESGSYVSTPVTLVTNTSLGEGVATLTIPANTLNVGSLIFTATYTPAASSPFGSVTKQQTITIAAATKAGLTKTRK
jgi:hypothetical protein